MIHPMDASLRQNHIAFISHSLPKIRKITRLFYSPNIQKPHQLCGGLHSWRDFYQSIKPTQMGLALNINMSASAFIEPLPVIEFVAQVLRKDVRTPPLSDADSVKVKKSLRGIKVKVTHRGNVRRKYRISILSSRPTGELMYCFFLISLHPLFSLCINPHHGLRD